MLNQPIDAVSYRTLIDNLLESLDELTAQENKWLSDMGKVGLNEGTVYEVCKAKKQLCEALKNRILHDLDILQQEANEFEGFDA